MKTELIASPVYRNVMFVKLRHRKLTELMRNGLENILPNSVLIALVRLTE